MTAKHNVDVWSVELADASWDAFSAVLNAEETEKAGRFYTPALRLRYRRCRTALRCILAAYLGERPHAVAFSYNAFGKPELPGAPVYFNVSHSEAEALIAVASFPVGVDIEVPSKPIADIDRLAEWVCHDSEKRALRAAPPHEKLDTFYRIWTQKEAYCKALGVGLNRAFSALRLQPLESATVTRVIAEGESDAPAYYAYDLSVFSGRASSVCLPLVDAKIRFRAAPAGIPSVE